MTESELQEQTEAPNVDLFYSLWDIHSAGVSLPLQAGFTPITITWMRS
jgi:hypothetical protein